MNDPRQFCREHQNTIEAVCDLLAEHGKSANEGRMILAWIIGLSMGKDQVPLTKDDSIMLGMLAAGWQVGAADTHD